MPDFLCLYFYENFSGHSVLVLTMFNSILFEDATS